MSLSLELELSHDYAGNGFGLVIEHDDDWAEVVTLTPGGVSPPHRNLLLWSKMLKPTLRQQEKDGPCLPVVIGPNKPLEERREEAKQRPPGWGFTKEKP